MKRTKQYEYHCLGALKEAHIRPGGMWDTNSVENLIKFEFRKKLSKFFKEEKKLTKEEKLSIIKKVINLLNNDSFNYGYSSCYSLSKALNSPNYRVHYTKRKSTEVDNLLENLVKSVQEKLEVSENSPIEYKNKEEEKEVKKLFKELKDFKKENILNYIQIENKLREIDYLKKYLRIEWLRKFNELLKWEKTNTVPQNKENSYEKTKFIWSKVDWIHGFIYDNLKTHLKNNSCKLFWKGFVPYPLNNGKYALLPILKADEKSGIYSLKKEDILNLSENKKKEIVSEQMRSFLGDFTKETMIYLRKENKKIRDEVFEEIEGIVKYCIAVANRKKLSPKKETCVRKSKKSIEI